MKDHKVICEASLGGAKVTQGREVKEKCFSSTAAGRQWGKKAKRSHERPNAHFKHHGLVRKNTKRKSKKNSCTRSPTHTLRKEKTTQQRQTPWAQAVRKVETSLTLHSHTYTTMEGRPPA